MDSWGLGVWVWGVAVGIQLGGSGPGWCSCVIDMGWDGSRG